MTLKPLEFEDSFGRSSSSDSRKRELAPNEDMFVALICNDIEGCLWAELVQVLTVLTMLLLLSPSALGCLQSSLQLGKPLGLARTGET